MIVFDIRIRGRNCEKGLAKTMRSLYKQTCLNWTALIRLDDPRDGSELVARKFASYMDATIVGYTVSREHLGVCGSMYHILTDHQSYEAMTDCVIVLLDGDGDRLPPSALRRVLKVYEKHPETLVTYGSYIKRSKGGRTSISNAYGSKDDVRKAPWHASHLKTFRACLLKHIKPEWFQDEKGKWLPAASDVALMLPLMEIAGLDRCRHIHKFTYIWNDGKVSSGKRFEQKVCEAIVRAKPRLERIETP
jgi:glycosyltransferase involved in cell wall biosynthesis